MMHICQNITIIYHIYIYAIMTYIQCINIQSKQGQFISGVGRTVSYRHYQNGTRSSRNIQYRSSTANAMEEDKEADIESTQSTYRQQQIESHNNTYDVTIINTMQQSLLCQAYIMNDYINPNVRSTTAASKFLSKQLNAIIDLLRDKHKIDTHCKRCMLDLFHANLQKICYSIVLKRIKQYHLFR